MATGVRRADMLDYRTWVREKLGDSIVPSNIQNRHMQNTADVPQQAPIRP